jgi:hypothetical protein
LDELDFWSISNSNFAGYTSNKNKIPPTCFFKLDFSNIKCRTVQNIEETFAVLDFWYWLDIYRKKNNSRQRM